MPNKATERGPMKLPAGDKSWEEGKEEREVEKRLLFGSGQVRPTRKPRGTRTTTKRATQAGTE